MNDQSDKPLIRVELIVRGEPSERNLLIDALSNFVFPNSNGEKRTDDISLELADIACRMYESRLLRRKFMPPSLLGEPAWDILLALYCLSARGETLSVTGLSHAANVPQTTSLRWSQMLEGRKLITRSRDAADARRAHVSLTVEGRQLMDDYLKSISATFHS